ncbi:MAG: protein-export rane protein SecF [Lachnospiraceae bacterium]|jgi:preprotein translocase SecF subunit|nr:protein-export rane protein SecF [Lachnospiraceae bacterium]
MSKNNMIHFYSKRWIFFAVSLSIMLIGIISIFVNGVQLDIQFKGGALLKYNYVGEINTDDVSDIANEILDRPVTTQLTTDLLSGEERLIINIAGKYGLDAKDQRSFDTALKEQFPDAKLKLAESSMLEAFFGKQFLQKGMIAIALSALLVMVYVWIRFSRIGGLSAGVMALIALFHDVLVVFFTCVFFQIPIGDSFVAVTLSIIGYSVNDTIVIYDRIRENSNLYPEAPVDIIADLSITQSITRSVNTNIAVLISVSMIYLLAFSHSIDSIQSFALPMAIGSISGCYSTICIAGPLWVMWRKHRGKIEVNVEEDMP